MDPEGTSRDDLDVRLHWPGADPDRAEDRTEPRLSNGALARADAAPPEEHESPAPAPASMSLSPVDPDRAERAERAESDALRATLAAVSARLDALSSTVDSIRLVVIDRLADHSERLTRAEVSRHDDVAELRRIHDESTAAISMAIQDALASSRQDSELDSAKILAALDAAERRRGEVAEAGGENDAAQTATQSAAAGAAIERLEHAVTVLGELASGSDERTSKLLQEIDETVNRLVVAQAEDLERIFDTVEQVRAGQGTGTFDSSRAVLARLDSIGEALASRDEPAAPGESQAAPAVEKLGERIEELSHQVETLRRRLAVRARNEQTLSPEAIQQIAEAVKERLATEPAPLDDSRRQTRPRVRRT